MARLSLQAVGDVQIGGAPRGDRVFQFGQAGVGVLDQVESGRQVAQQRRQLVNLHLMLARGPAQAEQALFHRFQRPRVQVNFAQIPLKGRDRFRRFDRRPFQRGSGFLDHCRMRTLRHAVEQTLRRHHAILDRAIPGHLRDCRLYRLGDLFAVDQRLSPLRKPLLLTRFRRQRFQLFNGMAQKILLAPGCLCLFARLVQGSLCLAPGGIRTGHCRAVTAKAGKGVEQIAVGGGIEQAVLIMLAVNLDQCLAQTAQEADADRLVIDEGAAAAVTPDYPADNQHLVAGNFHLVEQRQRRVVIRQVKLGNNGVA